MKTILFGLILLSSLTLAFAGTEDRSTETSSNQTAAQNGTVTTAPAPTPVCTQSGNQTSILSRAEAESLRAQEGTLLAGSDVGEIKVGSINSNEVIYILVVVLLVVLIIAVI